MPHRFASLIAPTSSRLSKCDVLFDAHRTPPRPSMPARRWTIRDHVISTTCSYPGLDGRACPALGAVGSRQDGPAAGLARFIGRAFDAEPCCAPAALEKASAFAHRPVVYCPAFRGLTDPPDTPGPLRKRIWRRKFDLVVRCGTLAAAPALLARADVRVKDGTIAAGGKF